MWRLTTPGITMPSAWRGDATTRLQSAPDRRQHCSARRALPRTHSASRRHRAKSQRTTEHAPHPPVPRLRELHFHRSCCGDRPGRCRHAIIAAEPNAAGVEPSASSGANRHAASPALCFRLRRFGQGPSHQYRYLRHSDPHRNRCNPGPVAAKASWKTAAAGKGEVCVPAQGECE